MNEPADTPAKETPTKEVKKKQDTLLSIYEVLIYGSRVNDLVYVDKPKELKRFARVYGFSYEGSYYELEVPTIMLMDGKGEALATTDAPQDVKDSFASDVRVWTRDKTDPSIRLDEMSGTIEDILLDVELGGEGGGRVSGGRVSGGRVSGGRVSGGRVSGGRVSGGRVSGGKSD